MGMIGTLLSFVRTVRAHDDDAKIADVAIDPGGGPNVTAEHYSNAGDDGRPLPGDYVATISGTGSGNEIAVGYLDAANAGEAAAGEKRIYSRRESDGAVMAVVWLKSDGTVELGASATEFVAVARLVLEELQAVKADIAGVKTAVETHIHVTTATEGSGPTLGTISPTTTPVPTPHTPASVASAVVKLEP